MTSRCADCKQVKDSHEFYKSKARYNGLNVRCTPCEKARRKTYDKTRKEYWAKYQKENKSKNQARWKVKYALKKGKMTKNTCELCGNVKVEGHHDDYSQPLQVRWLCHLHHMQIENHN